MLADAPANVAMSGWVTSWNDQVEKHAILVYGSGSACSLATRRYLRTEPTSPIGSHVKIAFSRWNGLVNGQVAIVRVRSEEHPRKKPYASELEKLMTWFRKAGVSSLIRAEWTPPMFLAIIITTEGQGPMSASVQTSTGWKIDVEIIQHSTSARHRS